MSRDYVYDLETYPNVFTCSAIHIETGTGYQFEYSYRRNDLPAMIQWLEWLRENNCRMVGFNNLGFDYPVIHFILSLHNPSVTDIYNKASSIIHSNDKFGHIIWDRDQYIPQIDLYKIHHFDNRAKSTSLKVLEFNMRSDNIEDLPYEPGKLLQPHEIDVLLKYNMHDVRETVKFYRHSLPSIRFREELTQKYNKNFLNHNDTKIGKDYFIMKLGRDICYDRNGPIQTPRNQIKLADIIFSYIRFEHPEFQRIHQWLMNQTITETKGVFKDLSCTIDGFTFDFGTGGIHGSVESEVVTNNLIDVDVASYYPNLAIVNNLYPEHLGQSFCTIYKDMYEQRKQYLKGTAENAMLKLALNGTYGDSNNQFSPFYDPAFTMSITINGQLLLCMLAEQLMKYGRLIQINTDGMTLQTDYDITPICLWWEQLTGLTLEQCDYNRMWIRDVNSYIAEYTNGKLKRKGAYEYNLEWHQNHSALVVRKAAEAVLVRGMSVDQAVKGHTDLMDFMLRTKIPRSSRLEWGGERVQNITRYYVATKGRLLVKVMPPLKNKTEERHIGINKGWDVQVCNNIKAFRPELINYDFYIREVDKLVKYAKI